MTDAAGAPNWRQTLEQCLTDLTRLRNQTSPNIAFKKWRLAAIEAIRALWPEDRAKASRFLRIPFLPSSAKADRMEARRVYDRSRLAPAPPPSPIVQPAAANPPPGRRMAGPTVESPVVDFGRYAGWRPADLARTDPDYLRWLSRHSSGIRYRRQINELLNDVAVKPAAEPAKKNWRGR